MNQHNVRERNANEASRWPRLLKTTKDEVFARSVRWRANQLHPAFRYYAAKRNIFMLTQCARNESPRKPLGE